MDRLNRPDILLLIVASALLLLQSLILSNKLPPLLALGGEEEEQFPKLQNVALLECDQVIQRDIENGGSHYWDNKIVHIGMGHGLASSITACTQEATLRR